MRNDLDEDSLTEMFTTGSAQKVIKSLAAIPACVHTVDTDIC